MPNWCQNRVGLSHTDHSMIARLVATGGKSLFSIMYPIDIEGLSPEEANNLQSRLWGTKWDVDAIIVESQQEFCTLEFDTAWVPPINFYRFLEKCGYRVTARYCECGAGYCGEYFNGEDSTYDVGTDQYKEISKEFGSYF